MRHIFQIITSDFRRLTSSVVAIVVLLGLCVVPCLYAWFNIFSNWDPYESESTGRIKVAVASELVRWMRAMGLRVRREQAAA